LVNIEEIDRKKDVVVRERADATVDRGSKLSVSIISLKHLVTMPDNLSA